jgi:hypothetical protein
VDHELAPGQQLPVTATTFCIRFRAGTTDYEIDGERLGPRLVVDDAGEVLGTATVDFGAVPLSPEQHLLLVALYDSAQCNGGVPEGNSVIAARLGWTPKKFHRKLDAVCDKLHRQGVRGLRGTTAELAESRRSVLVDHAVNTGLVGPGDLGLLRPGPRREDPAAPTPQPLSSTILPESLNTSVVTSSRPRDHSTAAGDGRSATGAGPPSTTFDRRLPNSSVT